MAVTTPLPSSALDLITDAFNEINAFAPGEAIPSEHANYALRKLNYRFDEWAARKVYAYAMSFIEYILVAGLGPHTIGPGAAITNTSLASNVATYTAPNNFYPGQQVSVTGTTNGAGVFNVSNQPVVSATATQFTIAITNTNVSAAADSGTAVPAGNATPNFTTLGNRPERIEGATLVLNNQTPNVDVPLYIRDANWWNNQRVKALQSNVPTDLYYEPDFPNGQLNFWPVPNFNYGARLQTWGILQQFPNLTSVFYLPPAYANASMLTLAEDLAGPYEKQIPPTLAAKARDARKALQGNNIISPRIMTSEAGQPKGTSRGQRADFNWETGNIV